jgi:hypothetical protein
MRAGRWTALVAAVLVLAGCAEIPTASPVQNGSTEGPDDTTIVYLPNPPAAGANPREIVAGFLTAASAGGDFAVAKKYLANSFVKRWNPRTRVLVQAAQPTITASGDADLRLQVPISARVSSSGVYTPSTRSIALDFHLVQQGGQWRIDAAPNGIVLGQTVFQNKYVPRALEFFDPTWQRLVPDLRWFPIPSDGGSTGSPRPASVVNALVGGPAGPLSGGVAVSALQGATVEAVDPGGSGVSTVALTVPGGNPSTEATARMQQQLIQSLQLLTPSALRLVVNGRVAPTVKSLAGQSGSLNAFVLAGNRFGTLASNGTFTEERTLGRRIAAMRPREVTISVRQKLAAVLTRDRRVAVVTPTGSKVVDPRPTSVAPTLDQRGWIYSVPTGQPDGLSAFNAEGREVDLSAELGGSTVSAIEVSPDGTRLLALVQSTAGPEAFVYGITRAADGTPAGVTADRYSVDLGGNGGTGLDATWVDEENVAVLVSARDNSIDRVRLQRLGGVGLALGQLTNATSIAGANGQEYLRIRLQTGDLWVWRRNVWQPESDSGNPVNVSVLAVQR